jgi:hypothetical protein
VPVCVTVTLLDGLVLARSTFHHSMNYRSVVVLGHAEAVTDLEEKRGALEAIVEHIVPGRNAEVCPSLLRVSGKHCTSFTHPPRMCRARGACREVPCVLRCMLASMPCCKHTSPPDGACKGTDGR